MCGIVGFTGKEQAAPILLEGLSKLEYRGYDSAGIAVRDGDRDVDIVKAKGRLKILAEKTNDGKAVIGSCGIGHTRWATHGEPSENNAHPHRSDDGNIVAVHNGIIENYQELKEKLVRKGYTFYSDTDTEVAVKLIDYYYTKYEGTPVDAINHAMVRIRGSYALAVMEGSLKMKEISYIHSEAYAAGELKHGTISLIEDDILVVGVLTQPELYEKTISNMLECKSRGAYLMGLTTFGKYNIEDTADFTVYIPKTDPLFATSLAVIPLQLLGYYISVAKGLDVDKPRNLAKSVTVE